MADYITSLYYYDTLIVSIEIQIMIISEGINQNRGLAFIMKYKVDTS